MVKRKARRPILDINGDRESFSPSRNFIEVNTNMIPNSTTSDEQVISSSICDKSETNPNHETHEKIHSESSWQQCFDENSGCWYHWNTKTNEVSWEPPDQSCSKLSPSANKTNHIVVPSSKTSEKEVVTTTTTTSKPEPNKKSVLNTLTSLVGYCSSDDSDGEEVDETHEKDHSTNDAVDEIPIVQTVEKIDEKVSVVKDDKEKKSGIHLVNVDSDSLESESDEVESFTGVFHWNKTEPILQKKELLTDESEKTVAMSSKELFKKSIEENYGDVPVLKKPKLIQFVKSNEILDLNKCMIKNQEESGKEIEVEPQEEKEEGELSPDTEDEVEAALEKALREHQEAQKLDQKLTDQIEQSESKKDSKDCADKNDKYDVEDALEKALEEYQIAKESTEITTESKEEDVPTKDMSPDDDDIKNVEETDVITLTIVLQEKLNSLIKQLPFSFQIYKLLIEIQTRTIDWRTEVLDADYYSKCISESVVHLKNLEHESMPNGWMCHWNRKYKMYFFVNDEKKISQWECPEKEDDEVISKIADKPNNTDFDVQPLSPKPSPPPPLPNENLSSAPLLPRIESPSSLETEKRRSDDTCDVDSISSPLPSSCGSIEVNDTPQMEIVSSSVIYTSAAENNVSPVEMDIDEASHDGEDVSVDVAPSLSSPLPSIVKKKKKTKLKAGLSLKKKGMSSLVKKWEKIKDEVK